MSYVEQLRRQKQLEHYQEDDPWGKETADAIAEFGTNVMGSVVGGVTDWWKRSSADQEGWFDDALRLAAGGVKNVAAAAEDQEGWTDDALRLAGGGIKNVATVGLNVLGAPGYVSGQVGGAVIGALGGDRRLGEWGLGFAGDIVLGGYAAKGLKVARAGTQYARLSPFQRALQYGSTSGAMASPVKYGGEGLEALSKGAKIAAKTEFASEIALAKGVSKQIGNITEPIAARGRTVGALLEGGVNVGPGYGATLKPGPRKIVPKIFDEKLSRTGGGDGGTEGLAGKYISPEVTKLFRKFRALQVEGPFKHHHIGDQAFFGKVLNRADYDDIILELDKFGIKPGNHPENIIAMMDQKPFYFRLAAKDSVVKQLSGRPGWEGVEKYLELSRPQKRILDDLFKEPKLSKTKIDPVTGLDEGIGELEKGRRMTLSIDGNRRMAQATRLPETGKIEWDKIPFASPTDPASYGLKKGVKYTNAEKRAAYKNRFKRLGIDESKIKYNQMELMLSGDHIDIVHAAYNSSRFKSKRDLLRMIDDNDGIAYRKLTPKEAAEKIAKVYKIQQNISVNVANRRLKLIKTYLKSKGHFGRFILEDPQRIRNWIIENRAIAGNLSWGKKVPDYSVLARKPKFNLEKEFKTVFGTDLKLLEGGF